MFSILNRFIDNLFIKQFLRHKSINSKCFSSNNSSNFNSDSEKDLSEMSRDFIELTVDSFKPLITDPKIRNKIELILSEYEYEKYSTLRVPSTITTDQMKDLLALNDTNERKRWISYLYKRENARNKSNEKRKEHSVEYWMRKRQEYAEKPVRTGLFTPEGELMYGLWHNSLFTKIPKVRINTYYGHRLRNAALFGPKLVIDMSFDNYMNLSECRRLAKQIHLSYNYNRFKTREPFDLCFANCDHSKPSVQTMQKLLLNYNKPDFMAPFHSQSYLELFPKDKLVYLSPHSPQTLQTFNCDDIYIMGGLLDISYRKPITYIKAEKEGIRSARLPIDEYVLWEAGSKYLCLNHIIAILHDMNVTGDWSSSLKDNIPQRKQKRIEDIEYEDMLRKQKLRRFEVHMKSKRNPKGHKVNNN